MGAEAPRLRIMLGFVVRQCAVALGHAPSATELAEWANNQRDSRGRYRIFGRFDVCPLPRPEWRDRFIE